MAKKCPHCGNILKDKSTFCGKCGKKWTDTTEAQTELITSSAKTAPALFSEKKKWIIGVGALLLAVALLLIFINPANSPESVFNRYQDCLRSENEQTYKEISYEANFSDMLAKEDSAEGYRARFSSADPSYKSGGKVNLLKDTQVTVIKSEMLKQDEIANRRAELKETYRNTDRITDIRKLTFEIKRGDSEDSKTTGTAELICVTGKWYIGDVAGI